MKRIILYIGILAAMFVMPVTHLDVGKLLPVQVVSIYKENTRTVIETDLGNIGVGETVWEALENLEETASGILYLDTAQYLLLTEETLLDAEQLRPELRKSVQLCICEQRVDLAEAGKYLASHGKLPKLKDWKLNTDLPVLSTFGDSLIFLKKVENKA